MNNENQPEHSEDTWLAPDTALKSHELPSFLRRHSNTSPSIATSLMVHTEEKSAPNTTEIDAPSVNSLLHIKWQDELFTPSAPMENIMNIVDVIVPVDTTASEALVG